MSALFHITTRDAWERACAAGEYRPASLASEGFIHLSTAAQWPATRQRFYRDVPDLVLLHVAPAGLEIRYERADGDDFPHLYGPLPIGAVIEVTAI
jgi:uncharacterized protein (DUF952 family)